MENNKKKEFVKDIDYYLESGYVIFTEKYLTERKVCCGNSCRHCPFEPRAIKGVKILRKENNGK